VAYDSIAPAEDAEAWDIGIFGVHIGVSVLAGLIGNERQIREAAFSEPRLSFNCTVVLRYRTHLESRKLAPMPNLLQKHSHFSRIGGLHVRYPLSA
jgi:hypothetical protein